MITQNPFGVTPFDQDPQTQPGNPAVVPSTLPGVAKPDRSKDRARLRMAVMGLQQAAPQDAGSPLGAFAKIANAGAQGYAMNKYNKFGGV